MKYLVFQDGTAVVFNDSMNHKNVALSFTKSVHSAGYCQIETYRNSFDDIRARVSCFGESTTLGISTHPDDAETISKMWY